MFFFPSLSQLIDIQRRNASLCLDDYPTVSV
jgi:hypothetical protein